MTELLLWLFIGFVSGAIVTGLLTCCCTMKIKKNDEMTVQYSPIPQPFNPICSNIASNNLIPIYTVKT